MEVFGQKLFFPPNFRFFHRLPARFEIFVVARGAERQGKTVFDIEIAGQRLALPSRVPLVPGRRYELEKISDFEFRIVKEKSAPEKTEEFAAHAEKNRESSNETAIAQTGFPFSDLVFSLSDWAILRSLEDTGRSLTEKNGKFLFDFSGEFSLKGIFHPHRDGNYTLFLSGALADPKLVSELKSIFQHLPITGIKILNSTIFDRISAGAINIEL